MSIPMERRFILWMAVLTAFLSFFALSFLPARVLAADGREGTEIIRVGYPEQEGLTDIGENGEYTGYTPDYLREAAQFTDWKYEFVRVEGDVDTQLMTLMDMLAKGEIDVMGGMSFSDDLAGQYDFVSSSYGIASRVLCALAENGELTSGNYFTQPNLRIAVIDGAKQGNAKLSQFCAMSGFTPELISFQTDQEEVEALRRGEVDAVYAIDISLPADDLKVIASFLPQPFYFAVTKGRKDLVNELNSAITLINESNPYFAAELHEKYFTPGEYQLTLSKAEKAYIARAGGLRVVMMGGKAPIQYRDGKTDEIKGLTKDILDEIAARTGLVFEMVMADTYEEYIGLLKEGKADIAAGLMNDYKITENAGFSLTIPYLHSPLSIVINNRIDPSHLTGKRLALPQGVSYSGGYMGETAYYNNIEECVAAVHRGEMDYCYGNSYSVQYYLSNPEYRNIITISRPDDWSQEYCFGVAMPADINLISILNKAIRVFPQTELIQNSLYENAYDPLEVTFVSFILANPLQAGMVLLILIMVFTIAMLLWTRYNDRRNQQERLLENERYVQISELSNEYLYEYDVAKDRLRLPERCARFLGCPREVERISGETPGEGEAQSLFSYIEQAREGSREIQCVLPSGASRWLRVISKNIDRDGAPIYSVGKITDIQEEKERQAQLVEMARRDSLTGLYNTAATRKRVTELLEGPDGQNGALMVIDVDRFKAINDTYGHYAGDQVLQALAEALASSVRKEDVVGRIGGDEFVVFLCNAGDREAVAQKCRELRAKAAALSEQVAAASVSIGVAFSTGCGSSYDTLYQNADSALYEVKGAGRDGYCVFGETAEHGAG